MKIEYIRELAEIMSEHGLAKIELKTEEGEITLKGKKTEGFAAPKAITAPVPREVMVQENVEIAAPIADIANFTPVTSPLVGVFYAKPSPDSEPYVKIGDSVKKGDTLCIVEAMKMMNEIMADCDGVIADICVENEQVVEFGQTLFKIS